MFRFKALFGGRLWARGLATQRTEARVKCVVLNRMTQLGMPEAVRMGCSIAFKGRTVGDVLNYATKPVPTSRNWPGNLLRRWSSSPTRSNAQGIPSNEEAGSLCGDLIPLSALACQTAEVLHQRLCMAVEHTTGKKTPPAAV
jgi:hypothetical protein